MLDCGLIIPLISVSCAQYMFNFLFVLCFVVLGQYVFDVLISVISLSIYVL